jgi:two-component system invasion response regulator UvrY
MNKKKVILADDDQILHEGLSALLEKNGYCVVASADSFCHLKELLRTQTVDHIVCDCKMPGDGPVNLLLYCKRFHPTCSITFLTGLSSTFLFKQLVDLQVDGLVSKKDSIRSLVECLSAIEKQLNYYSPSVEKYINSAVTQLTTKEFQVFELIVNGHSNNAIADICSNSPSTIGRHRENLSKKLKANSIVDLMRIAQENGLFDT